MHYAMFLLKIKMHVCLTQVEEESFQFVWQLKNYSALAEDGGEILSPIFTGGPKSKHRW